MSFLSRVLKSISLLTSSEYIGLTFSLINILLLLSLLSTEDYGIFVVILSITVVISNFPRLGLAPVLISDISSFISQKKMSEAKTLFDQYAKLHLSISTILF